MTKISQETPVAACTLSSQKQKFLNYHLVRVTSLANQEGTMEVQDEVSSSVGAQDVDTSRQQLSNIGDIELHWDDGDLNMYAAFRPSVDAAFYPLELLAILTRVKELKTQF